MANTAYQSSYTGAQIDAAIGAVANKADAATTLSGYGITDAFTKDESDARFYSLLGSISLAASSSNPVDLNSIINTGNYNSSTGGAAYVSHKPVSSNKAFRLVVGVTTQADANYKRQRFQYYNEVDVYERYTSNGGSTWSDWAKVQGAMVTVYSGSSAPSNSTGVDGDIYIQT